MKTLPEKIETIIIMSIILPVGFEARKWLVYKAAALYAESTDYDGVYKDQYYVTSAKFTKLKHKMNPFIQKYLNEKDNSLWTLFIDRVNQIIDSRQNDTSQLLN